MTTEKSCGAVVFRRLEGRTEYLVVQSARRGHWGFPKGHVEAGESEEDTARREVLEEAGLKVHLLEGFRTSTDYPLSDAASKEVVFFLGMAPGQAVSVRDDEIKDHLWLDYAGALARLTFENSREILKEAKGFLDMHTGSGK